MDVTMPDGTIVKGVPDSMTKAEFVAKAKQNGAWKSEWDTPQAQDTHTIGGSAKKFLTPGAKESDSVMDLISNAASPVTALKRAYGAGEAGVQMATGTAGQAIGGLSALGKGAYDLATGKSFDEAANNAADLSNIITEAMTFQPRTDAGQGASELVAAPFEMAAKGTGAVGEFVGGNAGRAVGEALPAVAMTLAGGKVAMGKARAMAEAPPKVPVPKAPSKPGMIGQFKDAALAQKETPAVIKSVQEASSQMPSEAAQILRDALEEAGNTTKHGENIAEKYKQVLARRIVENRDAFDPASQALIDPLIKNLDVISQKTTGVKEAKTAGVNAFKENKGGGLVTDALTGLAGYGVAGPLGVVAGVIPRAVRGVNAAKAATGKFAERMAKEEGRTGYEHAEKTYTPRKVNNDAMLEPPAPEFTKIMDELVAAKENNPGASITETRREAARDMFKDAQTSGGEAVNPVTGEIAPPGGFPAPSTEGIPRKVGQTTEYRDANGRLHRTDGPAVSGRTVGGDEYWQEGKLGNDNGPSFLYQDGTPAYYQKGNKVVDNASLDRLTPPKVDTGTPGTLTADDVAAGKRRALEKMAKADEAPTTEGISVEELPAEAFKQKAPTTEGISVDEVMPEDVTMKYGAPDVPLTKIEDLPHVTELKGIVNPDRFAKINQALDENNPHPAFAPKPKENLITSEAKKYGVDKFDVSSDDLTSLGLEAESVGLTKIEKAEANRLENLLADDPKNKLLRLQLYKFYRDILR